MAKRPDWLKKGTKVTLGSYYVGVPSNGVGVVVNPFVAEHPGYASVRFTPGGTHLFEYGDLRKA